MATLSLIAEAGRNKHGQRLVIVRCSCGRPDFACREDSFKSGNTKSCGCTRTRKAKTKVSSVIAPKPEQEITSNFERDTPAWFREHIESKKRAAQAAEVRVKNLQTALAAAASTDLDLLKQWTAESSAFEKLNHQIARLQTAMDKAETSVVKESKSAAELNRERVRALKESA